MGTPLKVLVVDDHLESARALALLIQMQGHSCRTAGDGAEALAEAAAFLPDLALLDIGLPDMDGFEVARRLRRLREDAVLAALTGLSDDEDRERSREAGFDHHLVKPVNLEALLALLDEVGARGASVGAG